MIRTGDVVLFQGDSITNAGRNFDATEANDIHGLGRGYPFITGGLLRAWLPEMDLRIYNRGVSGDTVPDLRARWREDCLALRPSVLSILVGVNDWARCHIPDEEGVAATDYGRGYRELLTVTRAALPNVRLVLCEPFALQPPWITAAIREDLAGRRAMVRQLAKDFEAVFVPFQTAFDAGCKAAPPEYWAEDGIHPTHAGHSLMARAWLAAVGLSTGWETPGASHGLA